MRAAALPCLFLCALASTARADGEQRALLIWERAPGAESCVAGPELARGVEVHAGRPLLVTSGNADVRASGRISPRPDERGGAGNGGFGAGAPKAHGWRATIEISRRDGGPGSNRVVEVDGKDCRALDAALVLVLTVAVEPLLPRTPGATPAAARGAAGSGAVASAAPATTPVPPDGNDVSSAVATAGVVGAAASSPGDAYESSPSNLVEARSSVETAPPERPPPAKSSEIVRSFPEDLAAESRRRGVRPRAVPRFRLAGSAAVAAGLMPGPAAGFGASVAWVAPFRMSFELAGLVFPYGQSPTDAGRAEYRALLGGVRACPVIADASVAIDACLSFLAGELRAEGAGFAVRDLSASRPYAAAGAALRARIGLSRAMFLRLGLEAMFPIMRDRFVALAEGGAVELHHVAGVVAVAGLDVGVAF